jgi:hypothetical protein
MKAVFRTVLAGLLPALVGLLVAMPPAFANGLVRLLGEHAALEVLLLQSEGGIELLSQVLRRGGSLGGRYASRDAAEALSLLESQAAGRPLADSLESFVRDARVVEVEARLRDPRLPPAERESLNRLLLRLAHGWTRSAEAARVWGSPDWIRFVGERAAASRSYGVLAGRFAGRPGLGAMPSAEARRLAHPAITTDLFHGEVISGEPLRLNGNMNSIYRVRVLNRQTGRIREAIFKPRTPGDGHGWNRVPMEYVAYEMNLLLGLDYVPPAAYRYGIRIGNRVFAEGSLSFWVPEARTLREVAPEALPLSQEALLSDSRVLNVLLHNSDAHSKNLLAGVHWADGSLRPVFIDFGASLRPGATMSMLEYGAHGNRAPVTTVRASTLQRLRALDFRTLDRAIGPFTTREEIAGILGRRDEIISFFDRLRAQHGDLAVLIPE